MSDLVYCSGCDAERAVLGRRCVLCGGEVERPPQRASIAGRLPAWLPLPLIVVVLAATLAALFEERRDWGVFAVAVGVTALAYVLAPWISFFTRGGLLGSLLIRRLPTEAERRMITVVVRVMVLAPLVLFTARALFG